MKRLLLRTLLTGLLLAGLIWLLARSPGYVLIAFDSLRFEATLWASLLLLLLLWLGFRLLHLLLVSLGLVNPWSRRNRGRRLHKSATQGTMDLLEGRWSQALSNLRRAAEGNEQPLIYYLGAARAAQQLGHVEECDQLVERALQREPQAELAIALSHAALQKARGDLAGAQDTLEAMYQQFPRNPQVLGQLARLYRQRGQWSLLLGMLPELRKGKLLTSEELAELEQQAWSGRLLAIGEEDEDPPAAALEKLTQAWRQLSSAQQHEPVLLLAYTRQLTRLGAAVEAEELLRKALKSSYDERLVEAYGLSCGRDPQQQLKVAESWLAKHPEDAGLLLCLGRICLRNSLWGKARDYFEASLLLRREAQTCIELARLYSHLNEPERSHQLYQDALELLGQAVPQLSLPLAVKV
jgi:HemY protein